ncbi:nuclear transport factor 2 family protein [Modestobacter sp. VKM Ac-2985]|uniref:nuclear transport factor 2 family protein n=1 Tax=Modestobacter sp. VKM Ac-2985 TaxID=3004139 RepID=UPI0022AB9148|nr:nuclear transport factor 2 family protein [Modestobacter sp. VKM Ac-2985]MCZ2837775.1 nuclear transport factor 2 family protein [Modestobacter sp. VKM Ac-2985]
MHTMTDRFADALHRLDADRDTGPLVELAGDDTQLVKLDEQHETRGREGATTFWTDYRDVFDEIETTFTHTVVGESSAALEWTSTGTLRSGKPFTYRGVTVIEGDEEQLSGVRTYYDSAAFLQGRSGTA